MTKELEELDKLAKQIELGEDTDFWEIKNAYKIVEQALIKAQEQEKVLDDKLLFKDGSITCGFDYKGKQIVAMPLDEHSRLMEQEEVLEIIKEKNVDIIQIRSSATYNDYNSKIPYYRQNLIKEEFDLIKRYVENEK